MQQIVERHEALRTRFEQGEGEAEQIIEEAQAVDLPVIDLSSKPEQEREERARQIVEQEARRGFDLRRGPAWRAGLVKLAEQQYVLWVVMHHIVSDGWSMGVMVREFSQLYEAYSEGRGNPLAELGIQYADYAQWQRQWLQGEVLEQQLSYWKKQLEGAEVLELPTDRVRPAVPSRRGGRVSFQLSEEETAGLRQVSRREGVTMFMLLMAGFQVVLSRYSGQQDITVGTEGLIGFFVNQLVLRTDLSGNPNFADILSIVRKTVLDAYSHQDIPFDRLVEELAPDRHFNRSPFFQVKLVLQNIPRESLRLSQLSLEFFEVRQASSKFDILLNIVDADDGLFGRAQFDLDLFDDATLRGLMRFYEAALRVIATSSDLLSLPKDELLRRTEQQARNQ